MIANQESASRCTLPRGWKGEWAHVGEDLLDIATAPACQQLLMHGVVQDTLWHDRFGGNPLSATSLACTCDHVSCTIMDFL